MWHAFEIIRELRIPNAPCQCLLSRCPRCFFDLWQTFDKLYKTGVSQWKSTADPLADQASTCRKLQEHTLSSSLIISHYLSSHFSGSPSVMFTVNCLHLWMVWHIFLPRALVPQAFQWLPSSLDLKISSSYSSQHCEKWNKIKHVMKHVNDVNAFAWSLWIHLNPTSTAWRMRTNSEVTSAPRRLCTGAGTDGSTLEWVKHGMVHRQVLDVHWLQKAGNLSGQIPFLMQKIMMQNLWRICRLLCLNLSYSLVIFPSLAHIGTLATKKTLKRHAILKLYVSVFHRSPKVEKCCSTLRVYNAKAQQVDLVPVRRKALLAAEQG